jgi:tetratricopeptide (TPR) repeat protein
LTGPQEVQITCQAEAQAKTGFIQISSPKSFNPYDNCRPDLAKLWTILTQRSSRTEQAMKPVLLSPRKTLITETQPTFVWQPVEGASGYLLEVSSGLERWTSEEITATMLTYPDDAWLPLEPGITYTIRLSTRNNPEALDRSDLQIAGETEVTELAQAETEIQDSGLSPATQNNLRVNLYRQRGFMAAAIAQLEQLISQQATPSAALLQQLGDLYLTVELYSQAEAAYQAALAAAETQENLIAQAEAYVGLANVQVALGETPQARDNLLAAERLYREAGNEAQADLVAKIGAEFK